MNMRCDMITVFVVLPDASRSSHEFLQLHRVANDYLGHTWQFVRGSIEPHESAIQAALRELREETSLVPTEFYRLGSVESFYLPIDDTLWHSACFLAVVEANAAVVLNDEHDDSRWTSAAEISAKSMWSSERPLLDEIFRDLLGNSLAKPHLRILL